MPTDTMILEAMQADKKCRGREYQRRLGLDQPWCEARDAMVAASNKMRTTTQPSKKWTHNPLTGRERE